VATLLSRPSGTETVKKPDVPSRWFNASIGAARRQGQHEPLMDCPLEAIQKGGLCIGLPDTRWLRSATPEYGSIRPGMRSRR
jgi:hypothetical protein